MSVAVTGATGFVGRHVVRQLEALDISPTLVCRPGTAIPGALAGHPIVRLDVASPPAAAYEVMGRPGVVIHLAWDGLPSYRSSDHLERELPAQRAFLAALLSAGLPVLAVTGTCLEYGLQSGELREDLPTAPVTAYGRAKDELRREVERIHQGRPFALTWARLFYVHGEGQAEGSLLPQLERALARGDPSFDMSGGQQVRDYLPVEAAAHDLVALALGGRDNGVVNICSGEPVTVQAVVEAAVARHGGSIRLNLGRYPYPDYEPMAFWGDPSKLRRCLEASDAPV